MAVKKGSIYLNSEGTLFKLDPEVEMDSVPTENSSNPVSNAGICTAIESKASEMFRRTFEPLDSETVSEMAPSSAAAELLPAQWIFTIDTRCLASDNRMTGIPVTLKGQPDISIEVDWGDGTSEILTEETWQDDWKAECNVHEYAEPGKYTVRLKAADADWNAFYIDGNALYGVGSGNSEQAMVACTADTSAVKYTKNLYYFKNTLVSLDSAIPPVAGMYDFYSSSTSSADKYKCRLTYENATSGGLHYMFGSCINLKTVSGHLFTKVPSLISVSGCFYKCRSLKFIPEGLFDSLPNLKYVSEHLNRNQSGCFYGCSSLTSIPKHLFKSSSVLVNVQGCFHACTGLKSIPEELFSDLPNLNSVRECFRGCTALESIPSGLFSDNPRIATFDGCFNGCTALQSIPSSLFSESVNASAFGRCFYGCTALQSIPEGLFDACSAGTQFEMTFNGCTALQSIPTGLFDSCTNAVNFYACFNGCTALQSIPEGLFLRNVKAESFSNCFAQCQSLQSLPERLFEGCALATTFTSCFSGCTHIQSIPLDLFENCTAAADFSNCFYNCLNLSSVPNELFAKNAAAANFSYCFNNCQALRKLHLYIGSSGVVQCSYFLSYTTNYEWMVCVPENSTTYTAFSNYAASALSASPSLQLTVSTDFIECNETWEFTIDTEAAQAGDRKTGIPFNVYSTLGDDPDVRMLVDWGDGNAQILTRADYATYDSRASIHEYAAAGEYTVTVACSDWKNTRLTAFNGDISSPTDVNEAIYWFRRTLVSVDSPIPKIEGTIVYTSSSLSVANTFNHLFSYCQSLRSIPSRLFCRNKTATAFQNTFNSCSSLQSVPEDIFESNAYAAYFYRCFYECTALQSIPARLLSGCQNALHFQQTFGRTGITSIPEGLFDSCSRASTFTSCFAECASLRSIPSMLFANSAGTTFGSLFHGCSSLQAIPNKLFFGCTEATQFMLCFYGCTSIQAIPSDLFRYSPSANSFNGTFQYCSGIQLIPAGLFISQTEATNFSECFYYCSSLTNIPTSLFRTNAKATTFQGCFQYCTGIADFHLVFGSSLVTAFSDFIDDSATAEERIFCVPESSTTYDTVSAFAEGKNAMSVETDILECATYFEYTVNTQATDAGSKVSAVPFNLATQSATVTVDWGDGTGSTLTPSDYTQGNCTASVHEYAAAGTYTITVSSSDWENTYFLTPTGTYSSADNSNVAMYWLTRTLVSVDSPLPRVKGRMKYENAALRTEDDSLCVLFWTYDKLASIPEDLFINNPQITNFQGIFSGAISLADIPANLFIANTAITNFKYAFIGRSRNFAIHITSPSVSEIQQFVTSSGTYTVYVPAGSTTYSTFSSSSELRGLGLTVIEE